MKYLLAIAFVLALTACTSHDKTVSTLEAMGFTDIKPGGYDFFGCAKDDNVHTKFTAKNASGRPVSGTVCCGLLFKNCTVRF